jgi:hypothetical protein
VISLFHEFRVFRAEKGADRNNTSYDDGTSCPIAVSTRSQKGSVRGFPAMRAARGVTAKDNRTARIVRPTARVGFVMKAAENWSGCDAMSARKLVAGRSWHRQRCRLGNPRTETRVVAAVIVMRHPRAQNLSQMAR